MPKQKTEGSKQRSGIGAQAILIIVGIVLFKTYIWDEYIINSTANAVLEGQEGEAGTRHPISEKAELAIKPFEDGFKIYAVSKGFLGWKVTDELSITPKENTAFEIGEQALKFNSDKKLYVSFVLNQDESFETVKAYSTNVGEMGFNRSVGEGGFFYYYYSEEPVDKVTYEGIRLDGKVEKLR
ncbi:hypothetical protein [Sporosarcina obsidiansis]|uniref:hypothetical protein n=1 Tax=Sporosarcina obsidiansis TaxID=2660748 RepID=UPI00129BB91D|nr:hypothetical protein [Sporosarcina obsidiansis]